LWVNHIFYHHKVLEINKKDNCYLITFINTKTGQTTQLFTKKLIVAAGAYTGELLKDIEPQVSKLITPKRMSLCFFKINKKIYDNYTEKEKIHLQNIFPVFDLRGKQLYAMIEEIGTDGLPIFKGGGHRMYNSFNDLDKAWTTTPAQEEINWVHDSWLNYLKINNLPIKKEDTTYIEGRSCVYSLTDTSIPLVSIIAKDNETKPQLVVIGGMSGIGAKGSMCYGWIAANLLTDKDDPGMMYQKIKKKLTLIQ